MTEKIKAGKYARISFIDAGVHRLAVIYGIKSKQQFIQNYAKTNGVEKALQLVFDDLGFDVETAFDEREAMKMTQDIQANNQEVWRWDNYPKPVDPIQLMFESSLTVEKS